MQDNHRKRHGNRGPGDEFGLAQLFWYSWRNWRKHSHALRRRNSRNVPLPKNTARTVKIHLTEVQGNEDGTSVYIDRGKH